jgi:predicted transposase/invertase (TIGR01784 family)
MIKDKYIDPFTDFGFKHIFGKEENKRFLISFLNALLDIDDKIVDIEYRNLEKLGLNIIDRKAIFDVYCTDEKGNNFIVELQRSKQEYFRDRSVYYTTFPIQEQSKKGFWDYRLKRVYFVGILDFKMDDNHTDYLSKVQLCNMKSKELFYDKLTYYYLEMPKFKKKEEELANQLDYWLWYLNNLAQTQIIPEKLKSNELIKEAFDVAEFLSLEKDEQFVYQLNLKARLDYRNVLKFAKKEAKIKGKIEGRVEGKIEGKKEGIQEGKKREKIEIAKNLLDVLDIETISLKTGLTTDEIEKLK